LAVALPDEPDPIPIHGASAEAVQLHGDADAVTAALNVPPPIGTDCLVGEMETAHGVADCGVVGEELLPHAVPNASRTDNIPIGFRRFM